MDFENSFTVPAPIDEVWSAMLDLERVAPAMPGARVTGKTADNAYKVAIKVKVGPVSMTYNGNVEIVETDEAAHRAVLKARAKESRGQGTANATVEMVLAEEDGATQGTMRSDVAVSGRVASMGQRVMADVSANLIQTFAGNLATMLSGDGPSAEPESPAEPPASEGDGAATTTKVAGSPKPAAGAGPGAAHAAGQAQSSAPPPSPPPPPRPAPQAADALDLGSVAGSVMTGRFQDPKVLAGALAGAAFFGYLLGRRRR